MNYEEITIQSAESYSLSLRVYAPENPKAVVKIIHGMQEYQGRYEGFAGFLKDHGFAVITADMRGHGPSAPKLCHIASKGGHELLVEDEKRIHAYIKDRFKGLPIILLGHSMGSIIARRMLQVQSKEYAKVVLSGYPNPNPAGSLGIFLSGLIRLFKGGEGHSKFLTSLVLGPFSKNLKDKETDLDWLSYNKENVAKYAADPLCGVEFTIGSYNALFHLVASMGKGKLYKDGKKDLPIYLISGEDDPCTGGEKGREASIKVLRNGFEDIEVETVKGMRHEVLNETDKEKVYELILRFIEK